MTRALGVTSARRFPRIAFSSEIASQGKLRWPTRFNALDPKTPVVDDPVLGASRRVLDMTLPEEWGGGGTTLNNPRIQLQAPGNLYRGASAWISFSLLFPLGYPKPTSPTDWNSFFQIFGMSTTGYPSFRIAWEGSGGFGWKRQPSKGGGWACQIEPQYGAWMDFAVAVHMHTDPAIGWIELWSNFGEGWEQRELMAGTGDTLVGNRLYTETITSGFTLSNMYASHIQNYRKAGYLDESTCFHGDHRQHPIVQYATESAALLAGTFTAIDPRSYG